MRNKKEPRLMLARLTEIRVWLSAHHFRENRDYTYRIEEPYVYFTVKGELKQQEFTRKWTPYYR